MVVCFVCDDFAGFIVASVYDAVACDGYIFDFGDLWE